MSATTTAPGTAGRGFLARNRATVSLGLGILGVLLLVTWLGRDTGRGGYLDPESASPNGGRALAQVLADRGERVEVVRGSKAFAAAEVDAGTTVVVSNPDALGSRTFALVDERVRDTDAVLVLAGLSPAVADGLGLDRQDLTVAPDQERTAARCSPAQPLLDGLTLTTAGGGLAIAGNGCFGSEAGRLLLVGRDAHRWTLLDGAPLTNDQIDRDDNAAVALRLLGQRDRVVWYVADADEVLAGEGTGIGRLLPRWLVPSLWLVGLALAALLLQRARRLGPLVTEPMPVTIRALESTTALGRLYEQARDRDHAAALLAAGTAGRLRVLLGVSPASGADDLVRAVAARTGRGITQVAALLAGSARTDAELVALAQELTQLEEEVRTP